MSITIGRDGTADATAPDGPRVLLVIDDATRRSEASTALVSRGYVVTTMATAGDLEPGLQGAAVVLLDVSLPRSWADVCEEHARLRAAVGGRCPVVLFGHRPYAESERGSPHIPWEAGGRTLLAFLKRLLATTSPPESPAPADDRRPTRMPSRPDMPAVKPRKRGRLLLVDDSEMTLDLMQAKLTEAGFDVRTAICVGELSAIASSFVPNVIVANVRRADGDIAELAFDLRALAPEALLLLSSSMPDEQVASLVADADADVDGVVSKRHGVDASVEQIVRHVETSERPSPPPSGASSRGEALVR